MPAYATFADVETRAGRYAGLFTVAGKQPDEESVNDLLENVSDELAAALGARGHDPNALTTAEKAALVDTTAYGALARALASVPGDDKLKELRAYAERMWTASLTGIAKGTHAVIALLEAGASGASAGSFWDEEPGYGRPEQVEAEANELTASTAPAFSKGMAL